MNKTMSVLSMVVLTTGACAFKQPAQQKSPAPTLQATVSWKGNEDGTPTNLTLDQGAFTGSVPVDIPVQAPNPLHVSLTVPASSWSEAEVTPEGTLFTDDVQLAVQVSIDEVIQTSAQERQVVLRIEGLKSLINSTRSSVASIGVNLKEVGGGLSIKIPLRTPPSRLKIEPVPVGTWIQETQNWSFVTPDIDGRRMNLIQVLRVTNEEDTFIRVDTPALDSGILTQHTRSITHRDLGCSYALDESVAFPPYSEATYVIPLDEKFLENAQSTLRDQIEDKAFTLELNPGQTMSLGVYAIGSRSDEWMDQGPLGTKFEEIEVLNDCYEYCRVYRRENGRRTDCLGWGRKRHTAKVTVGVERGKVLWMPSEQGRAWRAAYSSSVEPNNPLERTLQALSESYPLEWMEPKGSH